MYVDVNEFHIILLTVEEVTHHFERPKSYPPDSWTSHNISANQIRAEAIARRAAVLASDPTSNGGESSSGAALTTEPQPTNETKEHNEKRKRKEEIIISSIKAKKSLRRRQKFVPSSNEISDDENSLQLFKNKVIVPNQMENCETCGKRFLVTAYCRSGLDTRNKGLLCLKCSSNIDRQERAEKKKKNKLMGAARRKNASEILDGVFLHSGAKKLVSLCVETLANNVHQADSFGALPFDLVQRLSAILSKRRLITSPILDLFLEQKHERLIITDGAKLNSDDYCRIFQFVPSIKHLKLRNAIQFKNKVMDHLLGTTVNLVSLDLHGANLIDDERWDNFLHLKGAHLRILKIHFTDNYFGDNSVALLPKCCPELQRLKISHNAKVSNEGLEHIAQLSNLEHLSLELFRPMGAKPLSPVPLVKILGSIGHRLQTFSLESVTEIDDNVLAVIHNNCQQLKKLRITLSEKLTDDGFISLFSNWSNPPIQYIDFSGCRHVDAVEPSENNSNIGLCSFGFKALMAHSGQDVKHLNISSCRHISIESFESVFSDDKRYPKLEHIDVSFCHAVNDFIVGCIFRSCPRLKILTVFGCFGVKDVKVPKGRVLIGTPNALGMQIEGTEN